MQTKHIEYQDGDVSLEGYLAYDDKKEKNSPIILIIHDWSGLNPMARERAEQLAKLGYVGFAIDVYGKGKTGNTNEEKAALMNPFIENRRLLRQRVLAGYKAATHLSVGNTEKMAVMGYCFGGLCALDLARSGADLRGAVSIHGFFNAPTDLPNEKIKAKILAFYGADDPMVPFAEIPAFKKEMDAANVDWQIDIYGRTMHAFTNPAANDLKLGLMYNALADQRSWQSLQNFFTEIFM